MTPKSVNLSNKHLRWLLPVGLVLVCVLGFLQIPEVKIRLNPDFLWTDQLYRLQKEEEKANRKLNQMTAELASLKEGERPGPGTTRWLKKGVVSVTNSLHFLDAMLANLSQELHAGLPQAAPARRAQLLAYLQRLKTLEIKRTEYRYRLQEVSQKVQRLYSGLKINSFKLS